MQTIASIPGLDAQAMATIEHRWPVISEHLRRWLSRDNLSFTLLAGNSLTPEAARWLYGLEQRIGNLGSSDLTKFQNDWQMWCQDYLFPLARDLGLYERAEQRVIRSLWSRGVFDTLSKPSPHRIRIIEVVQQLTRPAFKEIVDQVLDAFHQKDDLSKVKSLLVERGLCRDQSQAVAVVEALDRQHWLSLVNTKAAALARQVMLNFHTWAVTC